MAKSKINQTIRKSVEGFLCLDDGNISIDVEDIGTVDFKDVFKLFNGENVKISISISNEGYEESDDKGE